MGKPTTALDKHQPIRLPSSCNALPENGTEPSSHIPRTLQINTQIKLTANNKTKVMAATVNMLRRKSSDLITVTVPDPSANPKVFGPGKNSSEPMTN